MSVIVGVIGALFKWVSDKMTRESYFKKVLNESEEIQSRIERIEEKYPELQRILVLQATNGGGIPRPNTKTKSSVLYEAINRDKSLPMLSEWQEVVLDKPYRKILIELWAIEEDDEHPFLVVRPKDLPDYSSLRVIYESAGVLCSRMYLIGEQKRKFLWFRMKSKAMYYVSFPMEKEIENNPEFERDAMELVNFLKKKIL